MPEYIYNINGLYVILKFVINKLYTNIKTQII